MSYQAVLATFSQIRLPGDLLLLQRALESLVEHCFMFNPLPNPKDPRPHPLKICRKEVKTEGLTFPIGIHC